MLELNVTSVLGLNDDKPRNVGAMASPAVAVNSENGAKRACRSWALLLSKRAWASAIFGKFRSASSRQRFNPIIRREPVNRTGEEGGTIEEISVVFWTVALRLSLRTSAVLRSTSARRSCAVATVVTIHVANPTILDTSLRNTWGSLAPAKRTAARTPVCSLSILRAYTEATHDATRL